MIFGISGTKRTVRNRGVLILTEQYISYAEDFYSRYKIAQTFIPEVLDQYLGIGEPLGV